MIIGPVHGLVHISSVMTLDLLYSGIRIPLPYCSSINQTVISMCLTLGVTLLVLTTEIQLVLYSQCSFCEPVWSARVYMFLRIT